MGWRAAILSAVLSAACYAPEPAIGGPCSASLECPTGQLCDRAAATGPTCVLMPGGGGDGSGSGSNADGTPANDRPAGAIDVSAGGMFAFDASRATDDADAACGASGGPDVFFQIKLTRPEVIYLDTIGAAGEPAIAVLAGECTARGASEACVDHTCGPDAQGAWRLGVGIHCILVDRATGPGQLKVARGGRDGDPLPSRSGTVTGNTCNDDDNNSARCDCGPAQDHHYFFALCPNTTAMARLDTCGGANWDTVLQLRDGTNRDLGCIDDGSCGTQGTLTRMITGPGLFWAIIDGCDECGPYMLSYSY
jgi:hypothetical protein